MTDYECCVEYIENMMNKTSDYNLRYDLQKSLKILKGEENQQEEDFVKELEEVFLENEELKKEKNELILKVESLKEEVKNLKG